MAFADDLLTVYLGVTLLLGISIYTLMKCRQEIEPRRANSDLFLFAGRSKLYSLASHLGSAFSLTYYGATIIYGHFFGVSFPLILLIASGTALFVVHRVLQLYPTIKKERPQELRSSNVLLDVLEERLTRKSFNGVLIVYAVIYYLLFIEELAVARLIFSVIFPASPFIPACLIATICVVILVYLTWGGFQAVLVSDFQQLKLLFPFLVALAFVVVFSQESHPTLPEFPLVAPRVGAPAVIGSYLFLIGWIAAPVDFYSRLNYLHQSNTTEKQATEDRKFAIIAILLIIPVFSVGGLVGAALPEGFVSQTTPVWFAQYAVDYVHTHSSRAGEIIFFASLFFMLFTTLNTLLITLLQIGRYRGSRILAPQQLILLILSGVAFSTVAWLDSVSAFGIFVGCLFLIPTTVIVHALVQGPRFSPQIDASYALPAFGLAVFIFMASFHWFELAFSRHFMLIFIVAGSILASVAGRRVVRLITERRRR